MNLDINFEEVKENKPLKENILQKARSLSNLFEENLLKEQRENITKTTEKE